MPKRPSQAIVDSIIIKANGRTHKYTILEYGFLIIQSSNHSPRFLSICIDFLCRGTQTCVRFLPRLGTIIVFKIFYSKTDLNLKK